MSGKVFQIKSQFENLQENAIALPVIPKKNHLFKRSATSFELLRKHENPATEDSTKTPGNLYAKVNKIPKSSTVSEFSRFNVDPLKRSSIRRSPAFRGEKPCLKKQISSSSPVDENDEIKEFLIRKSQTTNLQTCLTNSMKAALQQPLPVGPPPQKPPRLSNANPNSSPQEIKEKICFLENHLVIRKQQSLPTVAPSRHNNNNNNVSSHSHHPLNNNHASSNFLDCLVACHRNPSNTIYDSFDLSGAMVRNGNHSNTSNITTNSSNKNSNSKVICISGKEKVALNQVKPLNVFNGNGKHEDQQQTPIYMVPFSHENNLCPQNHQHKDAHYLCTIIDDSIEDGNKPLADKDEHSTIGKKTYDEIAILVDAAFNYQQPTEMGNGNDSDSVGKKTKVCRTLTEKRKDYVRRASANPEKRMESYQTLHQTFKNPFLKTFSQDNDELMMVESVENVESTNDRIAKYKRLIEENQPSIAEIKYREKKKSQDIVEFLNDSQEKLFQVCLLVGYNVSTQSAYLKMKYPPDEEIPDHIEQLIFPSTDLITNCGRQNQEHCLILTDEHGFKIYGYCRRVYPENSEFCLPLCYCVISVTKSLGFFHKLLKEIESRHGQSDLQMNCLLKNLQDSPLPLPGKYLHAKVPIEQRPKSTFSTTPKKSPKRLSLEANPKWLQNCSLPIMDDNSNKKKNLSLVEKFEETKKQQQPFDLSLINRSLIIRDPRFDEILIRRPSDLRLENIELSTLLDGMGVEILLIVFSNLLLERKVIIQSSNISMLSKSIIALQTILYPFRWQYTIVTIIPSSLIHICEAPFPVIAGVLEEVPFEVEDGIVVNLDTKRIVQTCNDEQTIIPDSLRESLRLSLEMVDLIDQGKMLSSVLISEAFLRFFIELYGVPLKDEESTQYHKEQFIQRHQSQNIKFFLEWFVETSMFRNFIHDRFVENNSGDEFYKLFNARILEKCNDTNNKKTMENIKAIVTNSKIINKKGKTFKEKFKKFFTSDISEGIKF